MPDLAFGIDIDLDRFEPEFGDERLDGLVAAAVFRYCNRPSEGISRRHGSHQVAQRLTRTSLPRRSAKSKLCPALSVSETAGAGNGCEEGTNSPSLVRSGASGSSSAAAAVPARRSKLTKAAASTCFTSPFSRDMGK